MRGSAADEVAWLLNLRGGDVSYNPVFVSYVIITQDTATLYVDFSKLTGEGRLEPPPHQPLLYDRMSV